MCQWRVIVSLCCLFVLSACVGGAGNKSAVSPSSHAAGGFGDSGTCIASHEWGGFKFNVELSKDGQNSLNVKVDMSETPWDVGVIEAWVEVDGNKILPSTSTAGAVVNHEASNVPAAVGASGMLLDSIRVRNVGTDNGRIGTAVTTTVGMLMAENEARARREQFDVATSRWSGVFDLSGAVDCEAKLWVRYWLPGEGVAGRRAVELGHCFCN